MPQFAPFFSKQGLLICLALLCFFFNLTFSVYASGQSIPTVNVAQQYQNGVVKLNGDWGFYWGEWIPLDHIDADKYPIKTVHKLGFLGSIAENEPGSTQRFVDGYGTYLVKIEGLKGVFERPAIHMRNVSDAWEAWWVGADGNSRYLGASGKISKKPNGQQHRYRTTILDLPTDSSKGTLVIYLSSHTSVRAGLFAIPVIQEHQQVSRTIYIDLASRILLVGVGIFVVMQNLIFYFQRPKEKTLLLLAIFGFAGLMRGLVSSDYFYVFLGDPNLFSSMSKLEYLLLIWPAVAGAHFFANLCPFRGDKKYIQVNYLILTFTVILTLLLPIKAVMHYLYVYHSLLLCLVICVVAVVFNGINKKMPGSQSLMVSMLPLILAVFNDMYAATSSQYNFFIIEYGMFLFFFVNSQIHASHYLTALKTAEHLSSNLQREVNLKTEEISIRNKILETKAVESELQRKRIEKLLKVDHLTGLFNRKTLDEYSSAQFKYTQEHQLPLAVIMMDIDNFKSVNDKYGHGVGDTCLKFVADYLANVGLRKDDIVARYGGEEIFILLPNTYSADAGVMARRICRGLSQQPVVGDHSPITLTASFGVAERITSDVSRIEDLIDEADKALYCAKKNGKNRVEVTTTPRQKL